MHLKRFRRETVQDALRAVREALGPGALVLSTRLVPAGGMKGWIGRRVVEITAAAERPAMSELRQPRAADPVRDANRDAHRAAQEIAARFEAAGMDPALARAVAEAHPADRRRGASLESLRRTLAGQVAPLAAGDTDFAPVEVFVGPPGVGKTTTIAKIAAQERARGGKRLGLVAADGFRVGAIEQLRLFADILGAPFQAARSPEELEAALAGGRRPVLLDTAGRSPADGPSREMFRLLASRADVRTHLVLAANTTKELVRRALDRFEDARPSRLVITKLDEAESLAGILPILRERNLPISYLAAGQNVPDDLERATPPAIAAWVSA